MTQLEFMAAGRRDTAVERGLLHRATCAMVLCGSWSDCSPPSFGLSDYNLTDVPYNYFRKLGRLLRCEAGHDSSTVLAHSKKTKLRNLFLRPPGVSPWTSYKF